MSELPLVEMIGDARSVLLAGAGGGYDVLGAVPLLEILERAGREVHLGSLANTYLNGLDGAIQDRSAPNLYEIPAAAATTTQYCPEAWLAHFFESEGGVKRSVWGFDKTGVVPLRYAYELLTKRLGIEAVVLVDGGIDSLLRGDETSLGSPGADLASIAAVRALPVAHKVLACVGFGSELLDGICHEQVLARIADITRCGGFLGASALVAKSRAGSLYVRALEHVLAHQASQRQSHVHRVVGASLRGEYGALLPNTYVTPLLSLYWFFALEVVADTHLYLSRMADTMSMWDIEERLKEARDHDGIRPASSLPL